MSERLHAVRVIGRLKVRETLIGPGYYITLTLGLLLGYFLVRGFTASVDSSGFNYHLHPVYDLIGRSLEGVFGATFVEQLFAEGPFLFALSVCFVPVFIYLAVSSVFRFGLEKKVGALELLAYGPADGAAYFLASFVKDLLLSLLSLAIIACFLLAAALMNNLLLGPMFAYSLVLILFFSLSIYAYGILASSLTENSGSAIALFTGIILFFLIILLGSFTIVSDYVQTLSRVFAWVVQWLSPFFYSNLGLQAVQAGETGKIVLSLIMLLTVSGALLFLSHITLKVKGVRA